MTKVLKYIVVFITATILVSCDYFGYFHFDIVNNTNDSLKIVNVEKSGPLRQYSTHQTMTMTSDAFTLTTC